MKSIEEAKYMEEAVFESEEKSPYIDEKGNVQYRKGSNKVCLARGEFVEYEPVLKKMSKDYYYMEPIYGDDLEELYIVSDVVSSQLIDIEEEFDNSKLSFKYGIIAIQRDEKGNIIPMAEKLVVPMLYDEISENNDKTVTAKVNGLLTYIDIDSKSVNYGKQIVPVILEHAVPFSVDYEGFAECSVNGVVGYLPRNCQPRTTLSPLELLTEEQVKHLLPYLESSNNALHESSVNKYSELTGSAKTLKLTRK